MRLRPLKKPGLCDPCQGWEFGLSHKVVEAKGFYAIIAILGGMALAFSSLDRRKALDWAAVINGVAASPIMVATMIVANRKKAMGRYTINRFQLWFGRAAAVVMGLAAVAMFVL